MGLVLAVPLMAVVAVLVKLQDGGPVFFRQLRLGKGAVPFRIWKFRTMVVGADALLVDGCVPDGASRLTRVGRLLRSTGLDELPQLINILRGEMSFVGPRPTLPEHLHRYTAEEKRRFGVRPGVTGLAQVSGRNLLPWSERLRRDCAYVDGCSLWLDARILAKTVKVVLTREGVVLDRNPESVDDLPAPHPSRRG